MRHLIKECMPWLSWKIAAVFVAVVLCAGILAGARGSTIALISATPLVALAACLLPCLLPLLLLPGREKLPAGATPAPRACSCGSDACQPQLSPAEEKHC